MELPVNKTFGMAIFIIVLLVVMILIFMIPKALGGIDPLKQRQIDEAKAKHLEDLNGFYNTFKKTDGGFDSYEASVLLAKVVEYTWEYCANFCEKKMDITDFTNFFLTHPITLSKTLDCDTEYVYDKETEHKISKSRISGYCRNSDLFAEDSEKSVSVGSKVNLNDSYDLKLVSLDNKKSSAEFEAFKDGSKISDYKFEGNLAVGSLLVVDVIEVKIKEIDDKEVKISIFLDRTDSKTKQADEWTTTIWGLYRNSVMCTNYIADGYQWGNMYCGSAESTDYIAFSSYFIKEGKRCTPLCGTGKDWTHEITQDRIKGWEGNMVSGKSYNNIKILYSPDCTIIKGWIPFSKQACLKVQIGVNEKCITDDNPPKEFNSGVCFGNTVNTYYCNNGAIENCGKNKDTTKTNDPSLCDFNKGCK